MTWQVQFTALAADDVADSWYTASRSGLGEEFLADVARVVAVIEQYPEACPMVHHTLRRARLNHFPYSRYYQLLSATATLEMRACVHQRQHPRPWRRRIKGITMLAALAFDMNVRRRTSRDYD